MPAYKELTRNGDEYRLKVNFNTDDIERENWKQVQQGNGFIRENGKLKARVLANIPVYEAQWLEANNDIDYLAWKHTHDRAALRRLLERFPHWRCSSGGF